MILCMFRDLNAPSPIPPKPDFFAQIRRHLPAAIRSGKVCLQGTAKCKRGRTGLELSGQRAATHDAVVHFWAVETIRGSSVAEVLESDSVRKQLLDKHCVFSGDAQVERVRAQTET